MYYAPFLPLGERQVYYIDILKSCQVLFYVYKINCLYLPLVYYLSLGLQQIIKNCPKLSLIIIIMFCFFTIHFLNYYYNIYPIEYKDSGLFVSNDYNRAISSLMGMGISPSVEKEDTTQIINILQDILNEENIHVGQLQTALQKVAPSADEIEKGTTEAKEQIEDATTISQEVEDSEATETTTMKNEEESLPSEEEE